MHIELCELCLANTIRVTCLVLSIIVCALSLRVVWDRTYGNKAQMFRFLGLGVLALGLSAGAYHSLGRNPYWPYLLLTLAGVILSILGTVPMIVRNRRK